MIDRMGGERLSAILNDLLLAFGAPAVSLKLLAPSALARGLTEEATSRGA